MRRTDIVTLASGFEERNSPWASSRRKYDAGYGVKSRADIETVVAFFEARHGALHGFRWRDPLDHVSSAAGAAPEPQDQNIGTGDGATAALQLVKTYTSGAQSFSRTIKKPVANTVRVAVNGAEKTLGVDFTIDTTTGIVAFVGGQEPAPGASVTAGFEFDTPVRFDTDDLSINLAAFDAGDIPNIPIIEVRLS